MFGGLYNFIEEYNGCLVDFTISLKSTLIVWDFTRAIEGPPDVSGLHPSEGGGGPSLLLSVFSFSGDEEMES